METKQKQDIILSAYKKLFQLCEDNGIRLIASSGTLIGLNRHSGFIPWDDDMDVMLFPDEYEKLKVIVMQLEENEEIRVIIENQDLGIPFIKVVILNDEVQTKSWKTREYDGFGIDIFKLDYIKEKEAKKIKSRVWKYLIAHFAIMKEFNPTNFKAKVQFGIIKLLGLFIFNKKKYIEKKYQKISSNQPTGILGYASRPDDLRKKTLINAKDIKELSKEKFEDTFLYNPNGFDAILTKEYGEWRKPVEVPQHTE